MEERRRTVVEVRSDLHQQLRKLALLNDLRIHVLANAVIEETLNDKERINGLIRRVILQA
ncbi:MAG: hypothetical protein P8017_04620 [Deltaproteobacteria bacterium]|jgi:hypothetical protein